MNEAGLAPLDWHGLGEDIFHLIGRNWMLITAGGDEDWNTMTASWGGFGHLWNRDVAFIFVRPSRHSFTFLERNDTFSLSFFGEEYRKALQICGAVSGRDSDKAAEAGLEPLALSAEGLAWTSFREARLVIGCRKLYFQDLDPKNVVSSSINDHYAEGDWHRMYVGAIEAAWKKA
jgi:flavin reductase (DIM6/NTAB) family NADH-FMN oxidoreductase RutF